MSEYHFKMPLGDFDRSLLPKGSPEKNSPAFAASVHRYFTTQFSGFGGTAKIVVDSNNIEIHWELPQSGQSPLDIAITKLESGERESAIAILELLLYDRKDDEKILYNLGMALSDVGRLREAQGHLKRLLDLNPRHTYGRVAFGVVFVRQGKLEQAIKHLRMAVSAEPENLWAQRNLGGCLAKLGQNKEAIECLHQAVQLSPNDQQSQFGLAELLRLDGRLEEADEAYRSAIKIDENNEIAKLSRAGLTLIARQGFEKRGGGGPRMDAVMYCLGALKKFADMENSEVQKIAFEIAVLGQRGLDVNDSTPKYTLKSLPGEFSGLHLVCFMFVGFKIIAPDRDMGFDLSREYEMAQKMFLK